MNSNTILTLSDELLERYRSSIPRKAFERFVEDITTGPAATAAPKFDASLLCRASFPAELEDDGGRWHRGGDGLPAERRGRPHLPAGRARAAAAAPRALRG